MAHARLLMISCCILLTAGCGFTLRGGERSELPMTRLSVSHPSGFYPLGEILVDALQNNGVATPEPSSVDYGLRLGPEQLERRAVSMNTRARAGQYELRLSVDVHLYLGDQLLAGPETFTATGSFFEDTANISGSNSGQELTLDDIRFELAGQMLRRLRALDL
jgi:LPS-assembly lipoprotein